MALNVLREKGTASLQALLLFCAAPGVEPHCYEIKNQWLKGMAFEALPLFIP